jgi:uncharacterized membrane protein (UPF0182 family)
MTKKGCRCVYTTVQKEHYLIIGGCYIDCNRRNKQNCLFIYIKTLAGLNIYNKAMLSRQSIRIDYFIIIMYLLLTSTVSI